MPRPRNPVGRRSLDLDVTLGPTTRPGWPDQAVDVLPGELPTAPPTAPPIAPPGAPPMALRRRTIPEPRLRRTGAAAVLGMVVMAALLGAVGGFVLLWLGTSMLQHLR